MKMNNLKNLMSSIDGNYFRGPSECSPCSRPSCNNSSMSGGLCSSCSESALSEVVGALLASRYHHSVKLENKIYLEMIDKIGVEDA